MKSKSLIEARNPLRKLPNLYQLIVPWVVLTVVIFYFEIREHDNLHSASRISFENAGISIINLSSYYQLFVRDFKMEIITSLLVLLIGIVAIVFQRKKIVCIYDELKDANEGFAQMANEIPGVVYQCIKKPDGKRIFLFIGDHISNIYPGLTAEDLYKDGNIISKFTHPDDKAALREAMNESIKNQSHFNHAYRLRHDDGKEIWVRSSSMPKVLEDSSVVWNGYVCDITYQIRAKEDRIKIDQYLQQKQKLESLGVLAGGIAHDFNNILCVIFTYCELIKKNSKQNGIAISNRVDKILEAAQRATDLCSQMMNYAGSKETRKTNFRLFNEVNDTVKMVQHITAGRDVAVTFNQDGAKDFIFGDNSHVRQLVMNLLINAIESVGSDDGWVEVMLDKVEIFPDKIMHDFVGDIVKPGKYLCLTIADNGCGMDNEIQKRIFEPFFTTKFQGRGLGLSAIMGIIKEHDGSIQFYSAINQGTTFLIFFPSESEMHEIVRPVVSDYFIPDAKINCILLADDEKSLRAATAEMIGILGFEVLLAENGKMAVEIFSENMDKISLIVLDRTMPIMNGLDAYREIRKLSPSIAIIFYSGDDMSNLVDIFEGDQYVSCLQKPYTMKELFGLINEMLNRK